MDWKAHFTQNATSYEETDFLRQVEKTVSGQPITPLQLEAQVSGIQKALELNKDDLVLDMCCGNGVLTALIARACRLAIGVDFSEPLIAIARKYNKPENVAYYCMSVLDRNIKLLAEPPFTKLYMYESLQYFGKDELPELLELILDISGPQAVIFFGGVPDAERIWDFYDTPERQEDYRRRKSEGREAIGTWWDRKRIAEVCRRLGVECEIEPQNQLLHSARYRFDVRLVRRDRAGS